MALQPYVDIVRRPISLKIFGIAVALLALMIAVTLSSSLNLHRVGQELHLLSEYYIKLDQLMGDMRAQTLREVIQIERVQHFHPKSTNVDPAEAQALFAQAGDCETESTRPVYAKIRKDHPDLAEQQVLIYNVIRLCTDARLQNANKLVAQALALPQVRAEADQVARFTTIRGELENIPAARVKLHAGFEKYLAQMRGGEAGLTAIQEQIDERRQDVSRRINTITRALHTGTRESAALTASLEQRTQWLSWSVTSAACVLGLIVAYIITRNLVRPVRELLALTNAIRTGNLDINIQIKTSDEIGLLADSFNHMVGEMRQKEQIMTMFGKYVDPRIVQDLLVGQQKFSQGGERQNMSVFFSDLEDFTVVCESLTPTAVVRLLNQYFSLMAEPIRANNGIIDKYIGDAVMAFWGPPFTSPEEHATLACYAALDQQARVPQLQALLPELLGIRKNVPVINVRMGIASGDVTVGSIGSEDARSYTVVGDNVNLASRLEGANKLYQTNILISEETRRLAGDAIEVREIEAIVVVGKSEPVRVFELLGRKGQISDQLAQLRASYERALACYRARDLAGARTGFAACLAIKDDDGPTRQFIARLDTLETQALPQQWSATHTLREK